MAMRLKRSMEEKLLICEEDHRITKEQADPIAILTHTPGPHTTMLPTAQMTGTPSPCHPSTVLHPKISYLSSKMPV